MVAQVNLLPESKQIKAKTRRLRQIVTTVLIVIVAVAIGVPAVLFAVKGGQVLLLNRTQGQINERKQTLKDTPDISTILTVKDHLNSLPPLYDNRLIVTELLKSLPKVMPAEISLTNLAIDTSSSTIIFSGSASSYTSVEKFVKALQRSGVEFDPNKVNTATGDFSNVTLSEVSGPSGTDVSFTLSANFSSQLIDGDSDG